MEWARCINHSKLVQTLFVRSVRNTAVTQARSSLACSRMALAILKLALRGYFD